MEKLRLDGLLGTYSDKDGYFRSEYQIGQRLVWVQCKHREACKACANEVEPMLYNIWVTIPDVTAKAEEYSRMLIPEFWSIHDNSKREGHRLDVWGITITTDDDTILFYVSRNHGFDFSSPTFAKDDYWNDEPLHLPDVPDDHGVHVYRDGSGALFAVE
ncbi:hypothetical protein [Dyella acidisoli]|nr:hypothetical protein [Dyella acidisoli]